MRIQFRQGLVTAPPNFLQQSGSSVSLVIAAPVYLQAALADGAADYLHVERFSVNNAWVGPFVSGTDYWLFWDIHAVTGVRTFGHTALEPIESAIAPEAPANDQHWFDTVHNKMKVWNNTAGRWVSKIRVFAAKYASATTFVSMSINAPVFTGTQVGSLSVPVDVGVLVFDINGDPIKRSGGAFFTTADVVTASLASASQVRVGAVVIEAVAAGHIPAYSIVRFSGFHEVTLATGLTRRESIYGMVEADATTGEVVNVVTDGIVTNPMWDWTSVGVNTPLYVDANGALTHVQPTDGVAVGAVVDINSILIRPVVQLIATGPGAPDPVPPATGISAPKRQFIDLPAQASSIITTIPLAAESNGTSYVQLYINGVLQNEGIQFTVFSTYEIRLTGAYLVPVDVVVFSYVPAQV